MGLMRRLRAIDERWPLLGDIVFLVMLLASMVGAFAFLWLLTQPLVRN